MKKALAVYAIVGCAMLVAAVVAFVIRPAWVNRNGPCVYTQPREVVSGRIHVREGGLFGGDGPTVYTLYYRGTYKRSGEECKKGCYVTEAEYERWMYTPSK